MDCHREIPLYEATDDNLVALLYQPILYDCEVLTLNEFGSFALSETPGVHNSISWGNRIPRFVTWADFTTLTGRRFVVLNAHIDGRYGRAESLELIRRKLGQFGVPVILVGDFNMYGLNPRVRRLDLLDASSGRPGGTFTGFGPVGLWRVDLVLVSREIEVRRSGTIRYRERGLIPSDHYPVYADIVLPPGNGYERLGR